MVAPADRAAAGADGVDVDHRQLDDAPLDLARVGPADPPALDDAHVAGGPTHVDADRLALTGEASQKRRAHGPAGGPGQHAPGARARGLGGRCHAAGGLHDQRRGQPELVARLRQPV